MAKAPVGARFKTLERQEFRIGNQMIARYLPEFDYRVTDLNTDFVGGLIEAKKAALIAVGTPRRPTGVVSTRPRK